MLSAIPDTRLCLNPGGLVIRQPSENIPYSPLSGCFHKAIAGTMLMKELTLPEATMMLLTVDLHYATAEHQRRPIADGLGRLLLVGLISIASIPTPPPGSNEPCSGSATDLRGAKVVYCFTYSGSNHITRRKAGNLGRRRPLDKYF